MENKFKSISTIAVLFVMAFSGYAQMKDAPANVAAALLIKVAAYERNISKTAQEISIYVLGDASVAMELEKGVGKSIGQATVRRIQSGDQLPSVKPTILFIADESQLKEALDYSFTNHVMSVTSKPRLVLSGVALGLAIGDNGKPKIMVNIEASEKEGLDWKADIFKVAKTIKLIDT